MSDLPGDLCYSLVVHRLSKTWTIEVRVQVGFSWDMVSGHWEVSRDVGAVPISIS